jgi:predicted GH43/DUF377 family glycosyl hydrolase
MHTPKKRPARDALKVRRLPIRFKSDIRRVITRPFDPGGEVRVRNIVQRVAQMSEPEADRVLRQVLDKFQGRHRKITAIFEEHYRAAAAFAGVSEKLSPKHRVLIGSYLTAEYSIESAALFNPSIVKHLNQRNLPQGAVRFIMSFRALGEGHLSSIVFRSGVIHADHKIEVEPPSRYSHRVRISPDSLYEKQLFQRKLRDIAVEELSSTAVMSRLPDYFSLAELENAIAAGPENLPEKSVYDQACNSILWLAKSNYQLELDRDAEAAEVVIFPQSSRERHGLEDLRMVNFVDDDGSVTYFGTYTAFDGYRTLPQLMETKDFLKIGIHTLNGARAQNKGMSLFPRRIDGHYVMCSRVDGENLYIMYSDIVHFWETAELLQAPKYPWELVQVGNCGSPLETPAGWLLLTHGVGPMRTYCIGAMLLDLKDPLKVIGHLDQPLISANEEERDGYVPNVVYTCGAMIHNDYLYIPFSTSDHITRFGCVSLTRLLERLTD